ncbi:hypothetical protein [Salinisphaera sp.]|uniref:hypothetical protein n=1 Tax=Salinisphaera sp. TaxID=1914330 RepID=UPI002D7929D2|nr:hypothetical protein [Salinisphaera sp.]HET7314512.1 hypothetical protein [Salinisphaera sp.]
MNKRERIRKQLHYQINFLNNSCRLYDEGYEEEALRIAVALENLISLRKNAISIVKHLNSESIKLYSTAGQFDGNKDNKFREESKAFLPKEKISGPENKIQFLDSTLITLGNTKQIKKQEDLRKNIDKIILYLGLGTMAIGTRTGESSYSANLKDPSKKKTSRLLPIREWMDEIVLITNRKFYVTREELIVVARNQDGGGHIAPKLKGNKLKGAYKELSKNAAIGYFFKNKFLHFYGNDHKRFGAEKVSIKGAHFIALRQMAHEVLHSPDIVALQGHSFHDGVRGRDNGQTR